MTNSSLLIRNALAYCFWLLTMAVQAQITVTGTITSGDDGMPLPGVNILEKGTSNGAVANETGHYQITVQQGAILIFSFVGFTPQEVSVAGRTTINITLATDAVALSEVVVVGYQTVRKKDLTGSVAQVGAASFNKGLYVSPGQLLQGKIAGVLVVGSSGAPGAETDIRIRGTSSVRGGNAPLIVVDGIQLDNNSSKTSINVPGGLGNTPGIDPLSFINPNDIDRFDILKDASATAIYGSRGANGVILITTKKTQEGTSIDFNASTGISNLSKKLDVLNGNAYRRALETEGIDVGDFGDNVDAFDHITQTGIVQNYNISLGTGNKISSHRFSLGYTDQEGIIKESGLKKFNGMLKSNYTFFDERLKVDMLLLASHIDQASAPIGNNSSTDGNLISQALQWNPTRPLYEEGNFLQPGGVEVNPLALLSAYRDDFVMDRIIASVSPVIAITDNLQYRLQVGIDQTQGDREVSLKKFLLISGQPNQGHAFVSSLKLVTQQISQTLTWLKTIDHITLSALAGFEYQRATMNGLSASATGFTSDDIDFTKNLQNATAANTGLSAIAPPDSKLQSFFGRANVNLGEQWLFTATVRADGSSRFGKNNRYGVFPSAAVAWNLHETNFITDAFNTLKFRLGWGETGSQQFPSGASLDRWVFASGGDQTTVTQANLGNPNLKWETTSTVNAGIDFAFFHARLVGSIDYFDKRTKDILFNTTTPQPGPSISYWTNLDAEVQNKGIEIALDGYLIERENLQWQLGLNATFLTNEFVTDSRVTLQTGVLNGKGLTGVTSQVITAGQPLNTFYLREWTGIGDDGLSTYRGFDEVSQNSPKYFSGDPNPNTILGISSTVNAGAFDLTINFNGALGHQIYNNTANAVFVKGNLGTRNTSPKLIGNGESFANVSAASTRYLENGDFLRLSNLSVGYTFLLKNDLIKNLRVYATGQNLLLLTDYSGFDPEVNTDKNYNGVPSYGIEYTPYPRARTFLIGVSASL